jgi:hypothetical protein
VKGGVMSNEVYFIRTDFLDFEGGCRTAGVRVFDEYARSYIMWDFTPDDDIDLFFKVRDHADDVITNILDYVLEHGKSIYVDQHLLPFERIEQALKEENSS